MENLRIRCRSCGKELEGISGKTVSCGCPNMATIRNGVISALDLSQVLMLNSYSNKSKSGILSNEDLAYQEARRQRKVRKLDFEIR
jgi:phage FluMu protein Com